MRKFVTFFGVLALILGIWLFTRTKEASVNPFPSMARETQPVVTETTAKIEPAVAPIAKNSTNRSAPKAATAAPMNWAETLDEILRAEKPESEKAAQLLAAFPNLAEADQIETAHHMVNLLGDDEFEKVKPYLLDLSLPEEVISILFHDSMLRPEPVKEPLFLAVMQTPNHPFAEQAKTALELFVGEDYKTDWPQWETALREKLKALEKE